LAQILEANKVSYRSKGQIRRKAWTQSHGSKA